LQPPSRRNLPPLAIEGAKIVAYASTVTPDSFDKSRFPDWDFDAKWPESGPTGYVLYTVNAALSVWREFPNDLESAIAAAIQRGGDTDSVAAIVGGLVGGN
jgi:ADP-ribosylglycohydrolase